MNNNKFLLNIINKNNDDILINKKYNPDVINKYNSLNRNNIFEFSNDYYKPITKHINGIISNSDDLIISKEKKDNNLNDKYLLLAAERQNENEIIEEIQKKFKNNQQIILDEKNYIIDKNNDIPINTFSELKNIANNTKKLKGLDDILNRLKELNIEI